MPDTHGDLAANKRLFAATRPFAQEIPLRSWWCVASTLCLVGTCLAGAALAPWWPVQLALSVLGGLVMVRAFILYHDFVHSSLLYRSRAGKVIFFVFGLLALTPPRYWRYSHNFHHAHVGKPVHGVTNPLPLVISDVGSFPLMTTEQWRGATAGQRLHYRVIRSPLTILMAYVTVFALGLCLIPFLKNPRKFWDGGLALLVHGGVIAAVWAFCGLPAVFFAILLPFALAAMLGAYLFYAQHNYEGMRVLPGDDWSYFQGSLQSSSYMKLGPVMNWFTGNIGYHHVHHLNARIPFYRLPEAMAAIPELQTDGVTTLSPREIFTCFRLNLWDPEQQRLVGYRDAYKPPAGDGPPAELAADTRSRKELSSASATETRA